MVSLKEMDSVGAIANSKGQGRPLPMGSGNLNSNRDRATHRIHDFGEQVNIVMADTLDWSRRRVRNRRDLGVSCVPDYECNSEGDKNSEDMAASEKVHQLGRLLCPETATKRERSQRERHAAPCCVSTNLLREMREPSRIVTGPKRKRPKSCIKVTTQESIKIERLVAEDEIERPKIIVVVG